MTFFKSLGILSRNVPKSKVLAETEKLKMRKQRLKTKTQRRNYFANYYLTLIKNKAHFSVELLQQSAF